MFLLVALLCRVYHPATQNDAVALLGGEFVFQSNIIVSLTLPLVLAEQVLRPNIPLLARIYLPPRTQG